jgi:hypothetical protein
VLFINAAWQWFAGAASRSAIIAEVDGIHDGAAPLLLLLLLWRGAWMLTARVLYALAQEPQPCTDHDKGLNFNWAVSWVLSSP